MDKYTATEQAYKHGYEKGYAAGKKAATDNNVGSKWIPVGERLPLNGGYMLVTTDGVVIPAYRHNDKFVAFTAIGVAAVGGVTHWMPLPEPPKEE